MLIVCLAMLAAIGLGSWMMVTTDLFARISARAGMTSSAQPRSGTIVLELAGDRCRQMTFDNDTGRTVEVGPCKKGLSYDTHGEPAPPGTARRLDAISRSFSGNR